MSISTNTSDSLRTFPSLFKKRNNKSSKTHIDMYRNTFSFTIRAYNLYLIRRSNRIVRVRSVNTNSVIINSIFHLSDMHLIVLIKWNHSDLNVKEIASLNSCCVSSLANDKIRTFYSSFFHHILTISINCHDD